MDFRENQKRAVYIFIYLHNRPVNLRFFPYKMDTEAPDATSEVIVHNSNNSDPQQLELLRQIQQGQAKQNSELITRLEALTQALTANVASQKRTTSQPENSGPKRKIARSNDERNYESRGNSSNSHKDVTRANAESDNEISEDDNDENLDVSDDNISMPDQDQIDKDIEALMEGSSDVSWAENKGPSDSLLDRIAEDLSMAVDKGEDINPQLAKIVDGLWANKLGEDNLKEKLKKYPTPANCSNMIVPKCNQEIWTNSLTSNLRFNDLSLQKTQCQVSKAATGVMLLCNQLIAQKTREDKKLETNQLISLTTDALALLGNSVQELSQRRREAIKAKLPQRWQHLASNVPAKSTLLFGDDINKRIQAISSTNRALTSGSASAFKRTDYQSSNSKGQSWQYSKTGNTPREALYLEEEGSGRAEGEGVSGAKFGANKCKYT